MVPPVCSPSEADKAVRKKALSPIALKILGTPSQSKKKKKKNSIFNSIFRTGFYLFIYSFFPLSQLL